MLIPPSEWHSIRQRAQLPAFEAVMQRIRREVDEFLAEPICVPPGPAGYYHEYFCPEHGVQLIFDPVTPTEHRCPVDGETHSGPPYDAAWRWSANDLLARSALNLALLWRLEGNPDHLAHAAGILSGYATHYLDYLSGEHCGENPGVVTFTTLDESAWIIPLAWAFDIILDNLIGEDAATIAGELLSPTAEYLAQHRYGSIHNVTCWHDAAIGTLGLVLGRQDLVEFAIQGELGFHAQLSEGVLADGLWYEGSFSYHFYTLAALLALAKATRHVTGLDLSNHPTLRKMLHAPIQCTFPNGSLPATNDCWYFSSLIDTCCHGVPPSAAFYEIGYAWYGDPLFAQALLRAYRHVPRDSLDALLFGEEVIPTVDMEPLPSVHMPNSGYAILRTHAPVEPKVDSPAATPDAGQNQRHLLLKHGAHGGVHGHPDKLSLTLYAYRRRLSPDLGTPGYGLDLFETWYRQTLSHNTVTIDGLSQPPATGQIVCFRGEGAFQVADARTTWDDNPYEGVTMRRVVLARPDYFLDLFLVECDRERRIDWVYRNAGECDIALDLKPSGPIENEGAGYEHISNMKRIVADGDFVSNWKSNGVGLQLFVAGASGEEIIAGAVPGNPPTNMQSIIINRRHLRATAYASIFHPYRQGPRLTSVDWIGRDLLGTGWIGCIVQLRDTRESWLIRLTSDADVRSWPVQAEADVQYEYCLGQSEQDFSLTA